MIRNDFNPDELPPERKADWDAWILKAQVATEKVIKQWEEWKDTLREWKKDRIEPPPKFRPEFDDKVWTGIRDWLLEHVFHNKCAYCETPIDGFPGDAEHFRPKGRVRDMRADDSLEIVKSVDEDNEEIDHPGYFWLAYNWKNLLPSCELCNRYGGKKDLFPVGKSHVAVKRLAIEEIDKLLHQITKSTKAGDVFYLEPDDLDVLEERLLLHPYYDNPEGHIYFKIGGEAAAWEESRQAEMSIKVYDLNHRKKIAARDRAQRDGVKRYFNKLSATNDTKDDLNEARNAAQALKDEYYRGTRPYAVAVFDYIHFQLGGTPYDPEVMLGERRKK